MIIDNRHNISCHNELPPGSSINHHFDDTFIRVTMVNGDAQVVG